LCRRSLFADFANHYGFAIKTHRIRRPRTKGKVERMVHYVKDGFLNGRAFADLADLNAQARHWLMHTANARIHATTEQRPLDLWSRERLTALHSVTLTSSANWSLARQASTASCASSAIATRCRPSMPARRCSSATRRTGSSSARQDMIVAEHLPAQKAGDVVADPAHIEAMWKLSLKNTSAPPPRWQLSFSVSVSSRPCGHAACLR
jgi:hypothetical protein